MPSATQPNQLEASQTNPTWNFPRLQTVSSFRGNLNEVSPKIPKRIIVCCDGTWQDGIVSKERWECSNVLKLSRTMNHQDGRQKPATPQIVFYQAGVGTEHNIYSEYIEGATGVSLAEKVQEAYAFIAHNYELGDEIFLFGFSRGAYTARMVAGFIGEIGVLDKKDMDYFADIFLAYQKRENVKDKKEIAKSKAFLEPFTKPNARGRARADADGDTFTIKCLGVFDTVGSIGLPEELSLSHKIKQLFGFPDKVLGAHIEHAFHAMALNETRADFDVARFEQTEQGRRRKQVLRQVWFAGCHTDVGGGYLSHDLSDISLTWMASNIEQMLSIDLNYLKGIPRAVAPWGAQLPHDPRTGIFKLGHSIQRTLPSETNETTQEYFHPSVMFQTISFPEVDAVVKHNPTMVGTLAPLEEEMKEFWPYVPGQNVLKGETAEAERENLASSKKTLLNRAKTAAGSRRQTLKDEAGRPRYEETWLGAIARELHVSS